MKFDWWKDINDVKSKYPLLKQDFDTGSLRFTGEIELLNPNSGKYIDIFRVEITYPKYFPYFFPNVIELDEKIPRTIERHVMPKTQRLCLAIQLEEYILCRHGISSVWFIDRILVPRLAEEHIVNNGGKYSSEYSHNASIAQWEFFMNLFNTKSTDQVLSILNAIIGRETPKGDKACLCGSGINYNKCHKKGVAFLQQLKLETIQGILEELTNTAYPKSDVK